MPGRQEMQRLVNSHAALPDAMEAAIWIRQADRDAWLLEILPEMPSDDRVAEPVHFDPGLDFRYPLHLIAGNRGDIEAAIRANEELAAWIADGVILHGGEAAQELVELAAGLQRV